MFEPLELVESFPTMLFSVVISLLAVLHSALCNAITENLFDPGFLSENSPAPHDLDAASSSPFDDSNQPLDFTNSEPLSFEDDLFTDSSAVAPFDGEPSTDSIDPLLESSCMTDDSGYHRYARRDGSICTPKASAPPPFQLKLPGLEDLRGDYDWPRVTGSSVPAYEIPPMTGYSRNDDECPVPKRRLCCIGPIGNMIPGFDLYISVNDCRGKHKYLEKVSLAIPRFVPDFS